jgi:hypothetical protein
MMDELEKKYDVDIEGTMQRHLEKMLRKGYMTNWQNRPDKMIEDTEDE